MLSPSPCTLPEFAVQPSGTSGERIGKSRVRASWASEASASNSGIGPGSGPDGLKEHCPARPARAPTMTMSTTTDQNMSRLPCRILGFASATVPSIPLWRGAPDARSTTVPSTWNNECRPPQPTRACNPSRAELFPRGARRHMSDAKRPDRNLAMELVRVTEAAALAAGRWVGRGDKNGGDGAAVDAMRELISTVAMDG